MPAVYDTLYATTFNPLSNTRVTTAYPPGATGIKQLVIQYKFGRETASFGLHSNIEKALKLQIIACMNNICMHTIKSK